MLSAFAVVVADAGTSLPDPPPAVARGGGARTYQPPGGEVQIRWFRARASHEPIMEGFQAFSWAEVMLPTASTSNSQVVAVETSMEAQSGLAVALVLLLDDPVDGRTAAGKPQVLFWVAWSIAQTMPSPRQRELAKVCLSAMVSSSS